MDVQLHRMGDYWLARWRDSANQRRTKCIGNRSKVSRPQAMRLCRELGARMIATPGMADQGKAPTLSVWLEHYEQLRADELVEGTQALHRVTGRYLTDYFGPGIRIDRITPAGADDWVAHLRKANGDDGAPKFAAATVAGHVRNAKTIFRRAVKRRHLMHSPFAEVSAPAPKADGDWQYVTDAQAEAMLEKAPDAAWRCLIALCRWAGLRRGEALRLTWGDVDWKGRTLVVRTERGYETTKQKGRVVPIRPRLYSLLREVFDEAPEERLGPCELPTSNLHRVMMGGKDKKRGRVYIGIAQKAGVPVYADPFHSLRKSCESEWFATHPPLDVAKWMGHSPAVAFANYHKTLSVDAVTKGAADATPRIGLAKIRQRIRPDLS